MCVFVCKYVPMIIYNSNTFILHLMYLFVSMNYVLTLFQGGGYKLQVQYECFTFFLE